MREISYVREDENDLARLIEERLTTIDKGAGIFFVGVQVLPLETGSEYQLNIGCDRRMDERTIRSLVTFTLGDLAMGKIIRTHVHRGVLGAAAKPC